MAASLVLSGAPELEREFGMVRIVGVFTSRTTAEELQRLLNARGAE